MGKVSMSLVMMIMAAQMMAAASSSLQVGFYDSACPAAEAIVREAVEEAVSQNPGIAAGLVRLHFHDCFVRGCDGSVLLDPTKGSPPTEKESPANNPSLRGFEVIDKAKAELEAQCPQTVSCADILAFAARDAAFRVGTKIGYYAVPAGRRDGRISLESDVLENLPGPTFDVNQLQQNFARKSLSLDEMVTLSGAHSIGVAHCSSFSNRLYSFNATHPQDPSMDPALAAWLKNLCSPATATGGGLDGVAPLDVVTPIRLDNMYYKNLRNHKGLLTSDQTLWTDPSTAPLVKVNANHRAEWGTKFAAAMVRMGTIEVLTGQEGEIRNNCRLVNII